MSTNLILRGSRKLPTMQETQVQPLCQEDPLEKGMATHSSVLAWRIPWTEEAGGLHSIRLQRVRHVWVTLSEAYHYPHSMDGDSKVRGGQATKLQFHS